MKFGIVGVVLFIAAYATSSWLYASTGMGRARAVIEGQPAADGTTVSIDVEDVRSNNSALLVNVAVSPGPALLDQSTHTLTKNFSVVVTSAVAPTRRTWSKGTLPDVFPVSLTLIGDAADWPFDRYRSGPITVELFAGGAQVPGRVAVTFIDRLSGWKVNVPVAVNGNSLAPYRLELQRSPSTAAFAVVILGVLLTLAGLALFVAVQTARDLRKFLPPMTTWYAAMLFAVIPLRNALPDAPPFGAWIDVSIVLWVIVVLVISMVVYISCWWRHHRDDTPTDPAESMTRS